MSSSRTVPVSVIIPAHNEANVLTRCLDTLLLGARAGELDVIVVANGCSDDTAGLARRYGDVRLIETVEASKPLALNTGDGAASGAVRVFLDADVTVDVAAVRELARVLDDESPVRAAAPRIRVDASRSSVFARAYLRVWESLPVFEVAYVGSGCYALSAEGRRRFGDFPDEIGDDRFVNRLFGAHEKRTLQGHFTTISAPLTLRGVVRRSIRVAIGSRLIDRSSDAGKFNDDGSTSSSRAHLMKLARDPRRSLDVAVYAATHLVVTVAARYRLVRHSAHVWSRDDTSRSREGDA